MEAGNVLEQVLDKTPDGRLLEAQRRNLSQIRSAP